jgi:hypothetical protein
VRVNLRVGGDERISRAIPDELHGIKALPRPVLIISSLGNSCYQGLLCAKQFSSFLGLDPGLHGVCTCLEGDVW